jgi:O-antigen ligase
MATGSAQLPVTRPRGLGTFVLPLPVAAAVGLVAGLAPHAALVALAAVTPVLVLALRVDWAALAVVGSAVFEHYLDQVSPWATEWLVAVLLAGWLVRRARGPLHGHRLRGPVVSAGVLLLVVVLAYAVHPHGVPGLEVCARYAALAAVMVVLADCLCGPLAPGRAARAYVLSCVLASVCGLVSAILSEHHRVAGPVESADTLAFFLVAAVPLVGTVRTRPGQPAWWVWACLLTLLAAGVGTRSEAAIVALLGMVLVALMTGLLAPRHAGAVLAVLATGAALVIALQPVPVGKIVTDAHRHANQALQHQDDVRAAALDMVRESPALGLGPAAFRLLHQDHLARDARVSPPVQTGSTVLEVAAEVGLLGLVALYAVWLLPAAGALRRWRRDRSRLTAATLLALGGLLTASLVEAEQYALPLWFLAAMAHAQGRPTSRRPPIFSGPGHERTSGQLGPR